MYEMKNGNMLELEKTKLQLGDVIVWKRRSETVTFVRNNFRLMPHHNDDQHSMFCIKNEADFYAIVHLIASTHCMNFEDVETSTGDPAYRFIVP